jgi:hypothetical protein
VYAVPAVLTVLAVGATTLAGLYAGTSSTLRDAMVAIAQGAPVRVALERPPTTTAPGTVPAPYPTFTDVDGVASAAAVWLDEGARLADVDVPLTMSHLPDLERVVALPDLPPSAPMVPVDPLTEGIQPPVGVDLPDGTRTIEVTLDADLVVGDEELARLQETFDWSVKQAQEGSFGDPLPEEEARSATAAMYADMLEADATTREWTVTLTLLDTQTGIRSQVRSSPVEVTGARVTVTGDDYAGASVEQGGGGGTVVFTLPSGSTQRLLDVRLELPVGAPQRGTLVTPRLELVVDARTDDGEELISEAVRDWGSTRLAPPEVVAAQEQKRAEQGEPEVVERIDPVSGTRFSSSDEVEVPPSLDTRDGVWTISGTTEWHTGLLTADGEPLLIGPGREWVDLGTGPGPGTTDSSADGSGDGTEDGSRTAVPVALTAEAARAADLDVGDATLLTAFGARIPATLAAIVPAVPGTLAPAAGLVDRDAVATYLAAEDRSLPAPDEVWIATAPGAEADNPRVTGLVETLSGLEGVAGVSGPDRVGVTDATSASRLVFWVASAGAVLLAVTGIAAVAATLLTHRRPEVAVLRALGMPPAAQARSRSWELGGVVLAAVALGLAASWLVGRAVVPELARSTTLRGQVRLPVELSLELVPWSALLGVGALLVLVVVLVQAALVRRQALDHDYREEIR